MTSYAELNQSNDRLTNTSDKSLKVVHKKYNDIIRGPHLSKKNLYDLIPYMEQIKEERDVRLEWIKLKNIPILKGAFTGELKIDIGKALNGVPSTFLENNYLIHVYTNTDWTYTHGKSTSVLKRGSLCAESSPLYQARYDLRQIVRDSSKRVFDWSGYWMKSNSADKGDLCIWKGGVPSPRPRTVDVLVIKLT